MEKGALEFLERLAKGLTAQFGSDLEIVVHDLSEETREHTIVVLENGHVSGRQLGDGPSQVVLEALQTGRTDDRYHYFTKTRDGRALRSSTIFIKDDQGNPTGIFSLNYDMSKLLAADAALKAMLGPAEETAAPPPSIPLNVNDLLDQLLDQSLEMIGKPVSQMNRDDKMRAVQFLNEAGAFLIQRSGDRVSKFFGISKYTLYSYFDAKETKGHATDPLDS